MQNEKIYITRLKRFAEAVKARVYPQRAPLSAECTTHPDTPIPYAQALTAAFRPIAVGEPWGELWACAWFRFSGNVPADFAGHEVGALIDLDGEGCVFVDGTPYVGLSGRLDHYAESAKGFVPLYGRALGGEPVNLLVEAGANTLFGEGPRDYRLRRAELVTVDRDVFALEADLRVLMSLAEVLPERSPRRQKILRGLNDAANAWRDGAGLDDCRRLTGALLACPACASAPTAWSMGHAHIDLAWLWPVRETRRKDGRTFATALRLMERYPGYLFGASQPQLYQWIKTDYPALYAQVKARVAEGRWECQGASWVEMDTNLTGGESLVRQIMYGLRFFEQEFGQQPRYLFLPDCFGFSAALPQILQQCGLPFFLTQKMSWNETNTFPHHTFQWEGIDGSRVTAHFLPTNDYNGSNTPKQLVEAERRYAQNDVCDDFANLYGIGDGGGGPSEAHIEYALRQRDLEGSPRVRLDTVAHFFDKLAQTPPDRLPVWRGELYLELHRGTYTTQARTKRWNRRLEHILHDVEFLAAVFAEAVDIATLWQDTLLHQFHDILPGSSIGWVYKDAEALSQRNYAALEALRADLLTLRFGAGEGRYLVMNTTGWPREEMLRLPNGSERMVRVPACGFVTLEPGEPTAAQPAANPDVLENDLLRVTFAADGTIESILDRQTGREWLEGPANCLLLWEDLPNNWGAWDVNHFYRETVPRQATLVCHQTTHTPLCAVRTQSLTVGQSCIQQRIELAQGTREIRIHCRIDWRETHKMLRVQAAPAMHATEASYEIQFGLLRRPTHQNTPWDAARFEVCGHRFADVSLPDGGFALLNDCKYGHSVLDNLLELNLLRSPADVDPQADLGEHEVTYAYLPHNGGLEEVIPRAHALNAPLLVQQVSSAPAEGWFYRVESTSVKLETVKPAEDGQGVVLRLYETQGRNAAATLHAASAWNSLMETDLLERPTGPVHSAGSSVELRFKPFEIKTLRLV